MANLELESYDLPSIEARFGYSDTALALCSQRIVAKECFDENSATELGSLFTFYYAHYEIAIESLLVSTQRSIANNIYERKKYLNNLVNSIQSGQFEIVRNDIQQRAKIMAQLNMKNRNLGKQLTTMVPLIQNNGEHIILPPSPWHDKVIRREHEIKIRAGLELN